MPTPRALVLRAPGANCDIESAAAFEMTGARVERVHVNRLLEAPEQLDDYQILCIPGGFSYGDDIAAGRILAAQMRQRLLEPLTRFKEAGKLILGICNGFQVLIKSGVLLDDSDAGPPATLSYNDSGKYEDRWVNLRVDSERCVFFRGIEKLYLPVAHAEGKFVARNQAALAQLEAAGQLPLRYDSTGGDVGYPANPNGSMANVAAVCDSTGRVLGMMPHPERYLDRTNHPRWTRGDAAAKPDGLLIFENAVRYFSD